MQARAVLHGESRGGFSVSFFAVAGLAASLATPISTPAPKPAITCAHRIICGPIRLIPRSIAGRERLAMQIVASLVEARAWSAQRSATSVSVPVIDGVTGAPTGASQMYSRSFAGGNAHSFALSIGTYLIGDAIELGAQSVFHMSALERSRWARIDAIAAVGDATRWRATFRVVREADRAASACQARIASVHAVEIAQLPYGPATVGTQTPAGPCSPFVGEAFELATLGASPSLSGSSIGDGYIGPAIIPRASVRWSTLALAAQAAIVPTAHALRNIGPIRIMPRDLAARRAFFANTELALLDGLITMHGTGGNPALEADPAVRPFVRGGLASLAFGWAAGEIAQRSIAHTLHFNPARLDYFSASSHLAGIASWMSPHTYAFGLNPWDYGDPITAAFWIRCSSLQRQVPCR